MPKKKKVHFIKFDEKTKKWIVEDETGKEVASAEQLKDLSDYTD